MRRTTLVAAAFAAVASALCPAGNGGGGTDIEQLCDASTVGASTTVTVPSPVNNKHFFIVNQSGKIFVRSSTAENAIIGDGYGVVLDISDEVYSWHDRGLVSAVFHPDYGLPGGNNFMFLLYGKQPAVPWADDTCTVTGDDGDTRNFCESNGALRRISIAPIRDDAGDVIGYQNAVLGPILLNTWCSSSMTHHLGTLAFLRDKSLIISAGEDSQALGAIDVGLPNDKCYIPGYGGPNRPQGSFRSQRMDFPGGKIIRVAPGAVTGGAGLLTLNQDYFYIAKGLRNPFRLTVHPVSWDVYIGDVGSSGLNAHEEINHIPDPSGATKLLANFGWPCMEGLFVNFEFQSWLSANPQMSDEGCNAIYAGKDPLYTKPVYSYRDTNLQPFDMDKPDACEPGGSTQEGAISGLDVYENGPLSNLLGGKLIFSDYAKQCLVYFDNMPGTDIPDFTSSHVLTEGSQFVDVKYAPDGFLYLAAWSGGNTGVLSVHSASTVVIPVADVFTTPDPPDVKIGQRVTFDASGSTNADGTDMKKYEWDFDGDGEIDRTTTTPTTVFQYADNGIYHASVIVTNTVDTSDCADITVLVGITAALDMTPATGEWSVGDYINFDLKVTGLKLEAKDVTWTQVTKHCYLDRCLATAQCHDHLDALLGGNTGLTGLQIKPISHEMPSYVEITATIKAGNDVAVRSFTTVAKQYSFALSTVPPGFTLYSGESGAVCLHSNPPCNLQMMAKNQLAVGVQRVNAMDGVIYAFTKWETTMDGKTTESTDAQVTQAAVADGTVVAYFEPVKTTSSNSLAVPENFNITNNGYEALVASWDAVEGWNEYYLVYLHTTTEKGLAHIPASTYSTSVLVAAPGTSVVMAVPDGMVDYVASVALYSNTKKTIGPKSDEMMIRTEVSDGSCAAADLECAYPADDPCTTAVPSATRKTGLGGFYDALCVVYPTLVGCYGGETGCRACLWDRCLYSGKNNGADPGYVPDCPPCVATRFGVTKGAQKCGLKSSDGVDPNQDLTPPAPTPTDKPDVNSDLQVELRSCLVGGTPSEFSVGNGKGEGGSTSVTQFQEEMAKVFGYGAIVSAVGPCNSASFSRRRLAAGGESGTEVTYALVAIPDTATADDTADAVISGSLDGSLALQLQMAGLTDVTEVITSKDYTTSDYSGNDESEGGLGTGGILAVAVCVGAAVVAALAAGVLLTKRRRAAKVNGADKVVPELATPKGPVEERVNPMQKQ